MWFQYQIHFKPKRRGFHLITHEVLDGIEALGQIQIGTMHLFLQHTSASLTLNENADPTVREDFESFFNDIVGENKPYYIHNYEGADDMPGHLKTSILGNSVTVPISNGRLALGVWQGIYLCEHRNFASSRTAIATLHGQLA